MTTNSLNALITGGTSGIGRATANKLARLGIHVIVVGRNAERGEKTVAEIRAAGGRADFISSDLRDEPSAREVARRAVELGDGRVDILINKKCSSACMRLTSRRRTSSSRNLHR
jgi:NAD(P)-dependent dehydrogenase (short-subunit alcohol dehydrogenase family)